MKTNNSPWVCNGGQTISDNVGSSRNLVNEKVLATSGTRAYGLQATSERSDYKSGSNMETTGDVRLKSAKVVSLLNDGTPRSSKPADTNSQKRDNSPTSDTLIQISEIDFLEELLAFAKSDKEVYFICGRIISALEGRLSKLKEETKK